MSIPLWQPLAVAITKNSGVRVQHHGPCPISTCTVCQIFPTGLGQTQQQRSGDPVEHLSKVLDPRGNTEVEIGVVCFSKQNGMDRGDKVKRK